MKTLCAEQCSIQFFAVQRRKDFEQLFDETRDNASFAGATH